MSFSSDFLLLLLREHLYSVLALKRDLRHAICPRCNQGDETMKHDRDRVQNIQNAHEHPFQ